MTSPSVIRRQTARHPPTFSDAPSADGWSQPFRRTRSRRRRRRTVPASLLMLPLLVGLLGCAAAPRRSRAATSSRDARDQAGRSSRRKIADAEGAGRAAQRAAGGPRRPRSRRPSTQLAGINADLVAVRKKITRMRTRINDRPGELRRPGQPARRRSTPSWSRLDGPGGRQAERAGATRKALLAERIRSAYDTDRTSLLEIVPVGRHVHRPPRRDELLHRRRRAGQGARRADRPRTRRRSRPCTRPSPTRATRPNALRQETAAQKRDARREPQRAQGRQGRAAQLEKDDGRATSRSSARLRQDRREQGERREGARRRGAGPAAGSARRSRTSSDASPSRATSRRSTTARCRWPMAGQGDPELRVHRLLVGAAAGQLRALPPGHRHRAPYGTPVRASGDGVVAYIGWNYADGADPAWIVIIAHSSGLQTWYAHMQPHVSRAASTQGSHGQGRPGHRLRGQHRPLDRRPPPLGGHAQRGLRQPAAVPVTHVATFTPRHAIGATCARASIAPRHATARHGPEARRTVKRTMAVILAGGEGERLSILSQERAKPAVPFGGKYRIIDFTLSNCVNSDIDDVVVLTQYNPRSLNDHIGLGPAVGPRPQPRRREAPPAVHRARPRGRVVPRHGRCGPAQHERHRARRVATRSSCSPATTSTRWTTSRSWPPTAASGPT